MTGLRCFEVEGVNDGNAIIALHADMGLERITMFAECVAWTQIIRDLCFLQANDVWDGFVT